MRLTLEKTKKIFIPNDPDKGFINIKALTLEEISKIESKATETIYDESSGVSLSLDAHKRANGVARACLIGWGNLFDEKGKELKFNRANITRAAAYTIDVDGERKRFLAWIDDEHTKFLDEVEEEQGEAVKN